MRTVQSWRIAARGQAHLRIDGVSQGAVDRDSPTAAPRDAFFENLASGARMFSVKFATGRATVDGFMAHAVAVAGR